jgi:DNA-binding transcriptional MerR regulator
MLTFDDTRRYRIGELARDLDRSTLTIKKWEESGLIPKAKRDSRGWRYYTEEDIKEIKEILEKHKYFRSRSSA